MLADSDWPRLCNEGPVRDCVSFSAFGVAKRSAEFCCKAATGVVAPTLSHGLGELLHSAGADTGVGIVE